MDDSVSDSWSQNGGCERVSCVMERIPSLRDRVWEPTAEAARGPLMGMMVWGSEGMGIGQSGQWKP